MCANKNKKIIRFNHEIEKAEQLKNERNLIIDKLALSIPVLGYSILFMIYSLFDLSTLFSLYMVLFSSSVTISFELLEWHQIFPTAPCRKIKFLSWLHPFLLVMILWIIFLIVLRIILSLYNYNIEEYPFIPNFISAITLLIYFVSYVSRSVFLQYRKYLAVKNKK